MNKRSKYSQRYRREIKREMLFKSSLEFMERYWTIEWERRGKAFAEPLSTDPNFHKKDFFKITR